MMVVVDFLMVNNTRSLGDYFDYTKFLVDELIQKGFIDKYDIIHPSTDFDEPMPTEAIPETVCIIDYINNKNMCWQLVLEFGTYASSSQLRATISSDGYILKVEDNYLEQLKLAIKNTLKKDWKKIIWLMDKDSEMLSVNLYPAIYRAENLARQLINEVMTKEYGVEWWDIFVPIQIRNKHRARMGGYKAIAPSFANVDERLMSIDIGDLNTIFELSENLWVPSYNTEINNFLNNYTEISLDKIKKILTSQLAETKNLWTEQFSKYLSADFIGKLREFELNRNHVVHNKLIDRVAYREIQNSIQRVEVELTAALKKVAEVVISAEQREATTNLISFRRQEEEAALLEIMESESGVRIKNSDEIIDLFDEQLRDFHTEFQTNLRFRNDIVISDYQNILLENVTGTLFEITYKMTNETSNVLYSIDAINGSQGEESMMELSIQMNDERYTKTIRYINGEVSFNAYQGNYIPETQDTFYMSDLEELMEELIEFIDLHFENMREKVDSEMYSIIKDGGNHPTAEGIYCFNCDEEYICVDQSYADFGKCLNCGEMNSICLCERCSCYFEVDDDYYEDDEPRLCDNCLEHYENE